MTFFNSKFRWLYLSVFVCVITLGSIYTVSSLMADEKITIANQSESHRQSIEAWRASRHERLASSDGWLTLVGLEWLKDGENRVGSAEDNDIRLTGGPAYWGSVVLQDDQLSFESADKQSVSVNGESLLQAELVYDTQGKPTIVASDTLSFYVIYRESFGLRIKDSQAPALLNFKQVENYDIDESWRINGRFISAEEGTTIEIVNVLGHVSESPVFGAFEFDMNGETHSLLGLGTSSSESLWLSLPTGPAATEPMGQGGFYIAIPCLRTIA